MSFLALKSRRKIHTCAAPKPNNTTIVNTLYHITREFVDSVASNVRL